MKVRDPAAASSRLTRWNSWTDGESPDGKRTQAVVGVGRRRRAWLLSTPRSPRARTRGPRDDRPAAAERAGDACAPSSWPRTPGVPLGPNPRVGCVLLDPDGTTVARGVPPRRRHAARRGRRPGRGPGTGPAARTAVVTLEPCNHTGRTGPCSAGADRRRGAPGGVRPVRPQPGRRPGAPSTLRAAGVDVEGGLLADEAGRSTGPGRSRVEHGRPFVTWKLATTLDGRSAAADGTVALGQLAARRAATCTGCAACATRSWSAPAPCWSTTRSSRSATRTTVPLPRDRQPLRAVMGAARRAGRPRGSSTTPPRPCCCAPATRTRRCAALHARDRQHVFLEGGPTLAAAFLGPGLVDEVVATSRPMLLGAGLERRRRPGRRPRSTDALHLDVRRRRPRSAPARTTNVRLTMTPPKETLMFTGIVEELGVVEALEDQGDAVRLTVRGAARHRPTPGSATRSPSTAAA